MAATFLTLKLSANTNPIQNFSLLSIPKCQNSSNFLCYSVNRLVRPRSLSLWCSIKATSFHIPSQITSLFSDATGKRTPDTSTSAERRIGGHAIMVLCLAVSLGLTRVGICRPAFAETPRIGHIELTLKQCPALRSLCMDYLYFGYIPLQNFYAAKDVCLDPNGLGSLEEEFRSMLKEIGKEETTGTFKLQRIASLMEVARKEDKAVDMLFKMISKAKSREKDKPRLSSLIRDLEMILVEMLIYQGKYDHALSRECLYDDLSMPMSDMSDFARDGRGPFYKAILFLLLGKERETAKKFYTTFRKSITPPRWPIKGIPQSQRDIKGPPPFPSPGKQPCQIDEDFKEFEIAVEQLKKEIGKCKGI